MRTNQYPMRVIVKSKAEFEELRRVTDYNQYPNFLFISILDPDNEVDILDSRPNHLTQRFYDLELSLIHI